MNKCVHNMLTKPWPKVGPQKSNRALVRMLFGAYAGAHGELSAVSQYFYNNLLTKEAGMQDLSELFACVSYNKMLHMEKLGHLILQYGGDPRLINYINGRPTWWSSGAIDYQGDVSQMLHRAVQLERQQAQEYRRIAQNMDAEPRALIERIIEDGRHHMELFERAQYEGDGKKKRPSDQRGREVF